MRYHNPDESPITREKLQNYKPAQELLVNILYRSEAQNNISEAFANTIDILSIPDIIKNVNKTLEYKEYIYTPLQDIREKIKTLEQKEKIATGQYGMYLEKNLPIFRERYKNLKEKLDTTRKEANTHHKVSTRQKEIIRGELQTIRLRIENFNKLLDEYA